MRRKGGGVWERRGRPPRSGKRTDISLISIVLLLAFLSLSFVFHGNFIISDHR